MKITLENIKGIKKLEYEAPNKVGIYVLTGVNGSGKSTLLTALARISDTSVFSAQFKETPFDSYKGAKISYHIEKDGKTHEVSYLKKDKKWDPYPTGHRLKDIAPFTEVVYISTTNQRFIESEIKDKPIEKAETKANAASSALKNGMKDILNTDKFEDLKYQTITNKGGGARNPRRKNRVYYIPTDNNSAFSELNFSLGERMVLNALYALENIKEKALLLIDEIELALHPVAQIRFYNYLKKIAKEKQLMVIISTHSPSLIRYASQRHFLEPQPDGSVEVKTDCYPSYILRDVTIEEETPPDYTLFVEDDQARWLLSAIIKKMKVEENFSKKLSYKIVPVGGWRETINLMKEFMYTSPYSKRNVEAFPDKDAEDSIEEIREKEKKTEHDKEILELWDSCKANICPLHITPELGVWEWLKIDRAPDKLEESIEKEVGTNSFRMKDIVKEVSGMHFQEDKPRKEAKKRLDALVNKLLTKISDKRPEDFYNLIYKSYVEHNYEKIGLYYKQTFCKIIGRK